MSRVLVRSRFGVENCELLFWLIDVGAVAKSPYLFGQAVPLQIDSSEISDGARIEQLSVREPDGDLCVAAKLAGVEVLSGRNLVTTYPEAS